MCPTGVSRARESSTLINKPVARDQVVRRFNFIVVVGQEKRGEGFEGVPTPHV